MWCIPNRGYLFTTQLAGASAYRLARFVPRRTIVVTKIGFSVTNAATNNDSIDVGLYDAAGNRLVSSGATAGKVNGATGKQTIDITATTLSPGVVYYAGLAYGTVGGTAATISAVSPTAAGINLMWGSGAGVQEISASNSGATLPATADWGVSSSAAYALAVLES